MAQAAGSVLINNIGRSFQTHANGVRGCRVDGGRRGGAWEKGDKRVPALAFHMQSRARVSAAGPLDRKRRRFPRAGRRIMAQKQAH